MYNELEKGVYSSLRDIEVNHLASEYISEHYNELLKYCHIKTGEPSGVWDKAYELLCDVATSICEAENCGKGYSEDRSNAGDFITPEDFVYGRIKGYSNNKKYQYSNKAMEYITRVDKRTGRSVVAFEVRTASTSGDEDYESLDEFQTALANAATVDINGDIELKESLRSNLELCFDNEDEDSNIKMIDVLHSFNTLEANGYEGVEGIFASLKNWLNDKYNYDIKEAFIQAVKTRELDRELFEDVLCQVSAKYGYSERH